MDATQAISYVMKTANSQIKVSSLIVRLAREGQQSPVIPWGGGGGGDEIVILSSGSSRECNVLKQ